MSAMERTDLQHPETWTMDQEDKNDVAGRCLAGLRAQGIPATRVLLDPTKLKGGYICDTMRVKIFYDTVRKMSPKATGKGARGWVSERPATAILKIASPASADHDVAMRLRLYEREWHFYEQLSHRVTIRVPRYLGSVKDTETGLTTEGVLLEDLEVPGAVLCPQLDDAGVMLTIQHVAKHHATFWNAPELASGALGVKPHNGPWYQPGWGDDIAAYWPRFVRKWEKQDARRKLELPPEAFVAGEAIMNGFAWIQDELSKKPHTFNHGDVKPPNMFMMPNSVPAFIDWQYTAVGKGCQDILFFLIEGYTIEECRRLEPLAMKHYHAALVTYGVKDYSFEDLRRDWKLAAMHFPFYVAMWFGTTPDESLVDPDFPRRYVPRAFDCILRNKAHELLAAASTMSRSPSDVVGVPPGATLESLAADLHEARARIKRLTIERDRLKNTLESVKAAVAGAAV